jgi:phage tail-like protein
MAGENQEAPWPVPKFHFKVKVGDQGEMVFQEAAGLDTEYDPVDYRARAGNSMSSSSVPGLRKPREVTLKKGVLKEKALFDYFFQPRLNTIKRETVTIQLLDETNSPMFTWTLQNTWPLKVTSTDLDPQHSEVVIDELVLSHEGLTLEIA